MGQLINLQLFSIKDHRFCRISILLLEIFNFFTVTYAFISHYVSKINSITIRIHVIFEIRKDLMDNLISKI